MIVEFVIDVIVVIVGMSCDLISGLVETLAVSLLYISRCLSVYILNFTLASTYSSSGHYFPYTYWLEIVQEVVEWCFLFFIY